jgi:uncharacterized tellurite resistance protein B-like protein
MNIPTHWDEKYLISFLYVFIAQSDFVLTGEESQSVHRNLEELLKNRFYLLETEMNIVISEVKEAEAELDETQKMETIRVLSEKIDLNLETYRHVVSEMDEIAHADHYVSVEEHSLMYYVRLRFKKDYENRV